MIYVEAEESVVANMPVKSNGSEDEKVEMLERNGEELKTGYS